MEFEQKKSFGVNKYIHNYSNNARGRCPHGRSRNHMYASYALLHKRRRHVMKSAIKRGIYDHVLYPSSSKRGNGFFTEFTARKKVNGAKENFHLSKMKSVYTPRSWRSKDVSVKIGDRPKVINEWNDILDPSYGMGLSRWQLFLNTTRATATGKP